MAIATTDDDVYTYIISIMEAIHKLPKNTKWETTKPKAQPINTGLGAVESAPNKGKGKGKGKGKSKGLLYLMEKERVSPNPSPSLPRMHQMERV